MMVNKWKLFSIERIWETRIIKKLKPQIATLDFKKYFEIEVSSI